MIVLTRSLGASLSGAWIAAVTYVFSGVGVSEVFFPHIHPGMALLPWIVWSVRREPSSGASGKVLLLSLLFGLVFLSGDVFTSAIALAASLLWILVEKPRAERARQVLLLAAAAALGGLIAAPQVLATALWIPETNRAVLGMKLKESLFFSIHPLRLLELVVPFPFGATWELDNESIWGWPVFHHKALGVFSTLYAGAFAVVALLVTRRDRAPGFRFARSLFLLSVAVAVPPSLLPASWGDFSSPVPLRNPEKFAVAMMFALGLAAGLACDRMSGSKRTRRWPLVVTALLTAAAAAAARRPAEAGRFATRLVHEEGHAKAASAELPGALAEGALLWVATVVALDTLARRSRAAGGLALALLTAVPIAANRKIARTLTEIEVFSPTKFARVLQKMDPHNSYRTLNESRYQPPSRLDFAYAIVDPVFPELVRRTWIQHVQALWNRGTVFNNDFDVGDLSRANSLRRLAPLAADSSSSQAFFGSLALRWGVRFRDQKPLDGYRPFGGDVSMEWDTQDDAEPDVRLAQRWVETPGGLAAINALPGLSPGEIVLETGRRSSGSASPGILHVLIKEPEQLSIETATADPSWLFVLRGFWSHRTVLMDGRPVEYVPAQLAFSAVAIPPGRHNVSWHERVPGGEISRWGPVLYLLFAGLIARRRRRGPG
jgi:hypothetical protein